MLHAYPFKTALFAIGLLLGVGLQSSQPSSALEVTVLHTSEYQLDFTVVWRGDKPLRLYKYELPWGNMYSVLTALVTARGDVLTRARPIDDPGPAVVFLQPGVPVRGRLALEQLYPTLRQVLKESNVIVFWSYQPPSRKDIIRTGGWLEFLKTRP